MQVFVLFVPVLRSAIVWRFFPGEIQKVILFLQYGMAACGTGGMMINGMEHSTYWGIFTYYFLSGDEWVKEQLLQGFKDRYQNPFVAYNNLQANIGGNSSPGHGHINACGPPDIGFPAPRA